MLQGTGAQGGGNRHSKKKKRRENCDHRFRLLKHIDLKNNANDEPGRVEENHHLFLLAMENRSKSVVAKKKTAEHRDTIFKPMHTHTHTHTQTHATTCRRSKKGCAIQATADTHTMQRLHDYVHLFSLYCAVVEFCYK